MAALWRGEEGRLSAAFQRGGDGRLSPVLRRGGDGKLIVAWLEQIGVRRFGGGDADRNRPEILWLYSWRLMAGRGRGWSIR
jgi:hypothetical protein